MSGNSAGGKAAAQTNKQRYGEDFYRDNGKKGGQARVKKGWGANHDLAVRAGRIGGSRSKRRPAYFDRLLSKIVITDGCWGWKGGFSPSGYTIFHVDRVGRRAHRVTYEIFVGKIPPGKVLDHLCENRGCVNPFHLEPTGIGENVNRGSNSNAKKTHCKQGHEYTEENTYRPDPNKRHCKTCRHERAVAAGRKGGTISRRPSKHTLNLVVEISPKVKVKKHWWQR